VLRIAQRVYSLNENKSSSAAAAAAVRLREISLLAVPYYCRAAERYPPFLTLSLFPFSRSRPSEVPIWPITDWKLRNFA